MVLKIFVKYGLPFSFLYCTIYQQNIWREGDDQLLDEQKRTWRKFFNLLDHGYHKTLSALNLTNVPAEHRTSLVTKFDSLDMKNCWNSKVQVTFKTIDQVITNPKIIACKIYRTVQPMLSKSPEKTE